MSPGGTVGRSQNKINVARYESPQKVNVARETIQLGKDQLGTDCLGVRQGRCKLAPVRPPAALCLHVLRRKRPPAAVEVAHHGFPLRLDTQSALALLVGGDA
jgi:hypothetical protein